MKFSRENMARNVGGLLEIVIGEQYSPEQPDPVLFDGFHQSVPLACVGQIL